MLQRGSSEWRSETLRRGYSLQATQPFSRAGSMRLHGFRQKRALRGGGLRNAEVNYLKYAAEGNLEMVKRIFKKYSSDKLNRNCTDYFDRTALTHAVTNRHEDMIEYLLDIGVELTESLFYAIDIEYTEAVEYILKSENSRGKHEEMLITKEESIFPRFLSPIMLAAHKNNFEILEILYSYGHRLRDLSINAANKWDEIRLKWLYYKARASQAFMILMWNKERVDPLNEAIDFYGILIEEGIRAREVRENLKQLASQCEDFAIALLDQLRTAQELADLLRFTLVGREHGQTNQLVFSTIPSVIATSPGRTDQNFSMQISEESNSHVDENQTRPKGPSIEVSDFSNGGTLGRRSELAIENPSVDQHGVAQYIRSVTDAQSADTLKRIATPVTPAMSFRDLRNESVPERRRLETQRSQSIVQGTEYARPIHFLKPIEKAVDNGMVRLVTCENSQLALTYLKDGLLFRDDTHSMQMLKKFLIGFFFPLISIAFYLHPNSKLGLIARNPTAKLWMEVASDLALIGLLVMNLILSETGVFSPELFSPILIVAYFWMPGKFINLCFLTYHQRQRVLMSIWNWNDFFTILFYTAFIILRLINDDSYTQWSPIPLSDITISVVYILVFLRPLEILRVNRTFGPLQVSVDRMMKDVSKFFLLFIVIWFAFSSGVNTLFWRYRGEWDDDAKECKSLNTSNAGADSSCCFENKDAAKFNKFLVSLQVHFWSLFGYSDNYAEWFQLQCNNGTSRSATAVVGEITFALYHVGTVLVLVNMLIAIMSGTLQKTTDESDIQWQFHRTRVWIRFIRTGFYRPPPMNLVPRPKEFVFVGKKIISFAKKLCCRSHDYTPEEANGSGMLSMHMSNKPISIEEVSRAGTHRNMVDTNLNDKQSRRSIVSSMESMEEDFGSGYDMTLSKCVKRYLKTRVLQSADNCEPA